MKFISYTDRKGKDCKMWRQKMTNEELKKKIEDILEEYNFETDDGEGWILDTEEMADALIAAGLTFEPIIIRTVELPDECEKKIHDILKEEEAIIEEVTHRAEIAERALYNACCEQYMHWCVQCESFSECDSSNEICIEAKKHKKELIKQAEKELAEERKDD